MKRRLLDAYFARFISIVVACILGVSGWSINKNVSNVEEKIKSIDVKVEAIQRVKQSLIERIIRQEERCRNVC